LNSNYLYDCPDFLKQFLFYMQTIKGRSEKTVNSYYIDLRTFFRYLKMKKILCKENIELETIKIDDIPSSFLETITLSDIYEFLNYTLSVRDNNSKTRSRKTSAIRSFFKYISTKTEYLKVNPAKDLEVPTTKKSIPKYLTLEESIELLSKSSDENNSFWQRNYCILTLFLNCGMRLSELVGINENDIKDNTLTVLGKGNKERIIYLNDACLDALKIYLDEKKIRIANHTQKVKDKNALFLSKRGTRITPRRVEQLVKETLKFAGLDNKGYSPHKLRHTAATLMYQHGGVDIRVLKEILGHVNLATTEIYTHTSNSQIEKAVMSSPLSKINSKKIKG